MTAFAIQGTQVSLEDLLALQTLAVDLQQINTQNSSSRRIGEQRSRFRGQGREFAEMKAYQIGDDVRQIDWRLTARKQAPFVRVMEEDRHSEHVVWLPLTPALYFGTRRCFKSVMLIHWAAFLLWRFVQLKHPIQLIVDVGTHWRREQRITSPRHAAAACQLLTEAHQQLTQNFQHLESEGSEASIPLWRSAPNLWMLSDFSAQPVATLQQTLQTNRVSALQALQCLDPFDRELPAGYRLPVSHKNHAAIIDTNQLNQQRLTANSTESEQTLNQLCHAYQGSVIRHNSDSFQWQEVRQWPLYH